MQTVTTLYSSAVDAKKRSIQAILDLYTGDALTASFQNDRIVNIEIQRTGEPSKFFGFGVSHKTTIKLLDRNRELNITKDCYFKLQLGVDILGEIEYKSFPKFYVSEVTRDENTNELTIVCYDILENTKLHTVSELSITAPYSLEDYARALATFVDGADRGTSEDYVEPEEENILPLVESSTSSSGGFYSIVEFDEDFQTWTINGTAQSGNSLAWTSVGHDLFSDLPLDQEAEYTFSIEVVSGTVTGGDFYVRLSGNNISSSDERYNARVDTPTVFTPRYASEVVTRLTVYAKSGTTVFDNFTFKVKMTKSAATEEEVVQGDTTINFEVALDYPEGANFEGTETIKDALDDVAEVTQTIYFIGADDLIHFRKLSADGLNKTLSKDIYISLKSGNSRRLQTICSATELGDNVSGSVVAEGETQYVRDNVFWELRDDIATLVDTAIDGMNEVVINEFECEWRGDPALEPGDRIAYITKDDKVAYAYLINDTLTYNGGLRQKTDWNYTASEETASNPTNLGEVLKQTYARVDKQNKEIQIVAGESSANAQEIAALKINTESISASVSKTQEANTDAIASINGELVTLTKKVEATMTSEDVKLEIKSELSNGVDKVTTATGFTFNEEGLTIAKTGSEMTTNIDEDGMSVYRDNEEVLTADNTGVTAYNLKARTYLIVGENSRFEDFTSTNGEQRTGCFWIGG